MQYSKRAQIKNTPTPNPTTTIHPNILPPLSKVRPAPFWFEVLFPDFVVFPPAIGVALAVSAALDVVAGCVVFESDGVYPGATILPN
jgi:hypothetical protein